MTWILEIHFDFHGLLENYLWHLLKNHTIMKIIIAARPQSYGLISLVSKCKRYWA